jgi:hypothetical protein
MVRWLAFVSVILLFIKPSSIEASFQSSSTLTSAHRESVLYAGPGDTHLQLGVLTPGVEVSIIERNRIGNWLHVQRKNERDETIIEGWVMIGYLNLSPELRFSEVPVNTEIKDADPTTLRSESLVTLYSVPVIPDVSEKMRDVYIKGLWRGNDPKTVTKVGDSLSVSKMYLTPMSLEEYHLGPYDYLQETIDYFGASTADHSVASRIGMSSLVVFDSMWATDERCKEDESPLECEFRLKKPSIALVLFGPNDVLSMNSETYREQMTKIVQTSLDHGVIPVLSTFSVDPDYEYWWQSVNFNIALTEIAAEYEVPLMNLWAAARPLPNYGLDSDNVHLAHSGFQVLQLDRGHETWYGVSLQNLLAIRTLNEIKETLKMSQ